MSLYHELKRRNVLRVAIAYLALAWLLTEVAGTLFPAFGIPDWGFRFVVIVFVLGFVPVLIISCGLPSVLMTLLGYDPSI